MAGLDAFLARGLFFLLLLRWGVGEGGGEGEERGGEGGEMIVLGGGL